MTSAAAVAAGAKAIVKLVLTGDVMLGRGVDAVNRVHCDPVLYESYCKSAFDYVALARRRSGYPARDHPAAARDNPSRVWGTLLGDLRGERRQQQLQQKTEEAPSAAPPPRLLLMNLETAITAGGHPWWGGAS
jgi:hypothetical protein